MVVKLHNFRLMLLIIIVPILFSCATTQQKQREAQSCQQTFRATWESVAIAAGETAEPSLENSKLYLMQAAGGSFTMALASTDTKTEAQGTAQEQKCKELQANINTTLKETVEAGCKPTLEQISNLMNNPISNLVLLQTQNDLMAIQGDHTGGTRYVDRFQFIPTFPLSISKDLNLISRTVFSFLSVPVNKKVGNLFGASPGDIVSDPSLLRFAPDPWGRTNGFGDLTYIGLIAPKKSPKVFGGNLLYAAGPTFIFPTASQDVLGQGKYQVGPAALLAWIGEKWRLGLFPMQWWSYGGDTSRKATNQFNLQYFIYYAPNPLWYTMYAKVMPRVLDVMRSVGRSRIKSSIHEGH